MKNTSGGRGSAACHAEPSYGNEEHKLCRFICKARNMNATAMRKERLARQKKKIEKISSITLHKIGCKTGTRVFYLGPKYEISQL